MPHSEVAEVNECESVELTGDRITGRGVFLHYLMLINIFHPINIKFGNNEITFIYVEE